MLRNDEIQTALVAYIKANANIIAELDAGADEVREYQWQGTQFTYPNIRVRMIDNIPLDRNCNHSTIRFSLLVFSEDASSLEANRISGIINSELHDKSFTYTSIGFSLWTTNLVPAIRQDARTWRSEVMMEGIASG